MNRHQLFVIGLILVVALAILGVRQFFIQKSAQIISPEIITETDTTSSYANIKYQFPKNDVGAAGIEARVKEIVSNWKKENIDVLTQNDIAVQELGGDRKYELNILYSKTFNSKYITHVIEIYSFTGGAHGITTIETTTVDTKGVESTLNDILKDPKTGIAALTEKLKTKLETDFSERIYSEKGMFEDGLKPEAIASLSFEVTNVGIIFIFGDYQVGPHSSGIIEVPLLYSELTDILNEKFIPTAQEYLTDEELALADKFEVQNPSIWEMTLPNGEIVAEFMCKTDPDYFKKHATDIDWEKCLAYRDYLTKEEAVVLDTLPEGPEVSIWDTQLPNGENAGETLCKKDPEFLKKWDTGNDWERCVTYRKKNNLK